MGFYRGPNVVTDGLVLALDAANPTSYVSGSTTWQDLSGNSYNWSLINTPTVGSNYLGFNGTDQYTTITNGIGMIV